MPKLQQIIVSTLLATVLFFISSFLNLKASIVYADYNSAYQDYIYNYQLYRSASDKFQIDKSSYLTYKTITAQNNALTSFRTVLKTRDQVMLVYYNLLQEKLNATAGSSTDSKNTFNSIKDSEKDWLGSHQKKIDAAGSLDDLNSVSAEFESHYPQMDTEAKQTIATVEKAKLSNLKSQLDNQMGSLNGKIGQIRFMGIDTSVWDRDMILSQNQLNLYNQKIDAADAIFYPRSISNYQLIDLYSGQKSLLEAKQYLRETVNSLLQIIKEITG